MGYTLQDGGPMGANLIFFFLTLVFTYVFQREHAVRCFVLPLQKNAARLFLLAPVYTFFTILTAYVTRVKPLWDILMAIVDGYALYCFFGLLVLGAGGEDAVKRKLASTRGAASGSGGSSGASNIGGGNDGGKLGFKLCLCIPIHFDNADTFYLFFKRSVVQVMFTRPVFLAISAICERSPAAAGPLLERVFRLAALVVLVYAVMMIGRMYASIRDGLWKAFNPIAAFMIVKGFILIITIQDFIIAMVYSKKDPDYVHPQTKAALRAYSLIVSIESILYLFLLRHFMHHRVFQAYNTRTNSPITISQGTFFKEVYTFFNVLDVDMPVSCESEVKPIVDARDSIENIEVGVVSSHSTPVSSSSTSSARRG